MALGYMSVKCNLIWGVGAFGAICLAWRQTSEKEFLKSVEWLSQEKFTKLGVGNATNRHERVNMHPPDQKASTLATEACVHTDPCCCGIH